MPITLTIDDDVRDLVMNAIARSAKNFDNMEIHEQSSSYAVDQKTRVRWAEMSSKLWAIVRQFSDPSKELSPELDKSIDEFIADKPKDIMKE